MVGIKLYIVGVSLKSTALIITLIHFLGNTLMAAPTATALADKISVSMLGWE